MSVLDLSLRLHHRRTLGTATVTCHSTGRIAATGDPELCRTVLGAFADGVVLLDGVDRADLGADMVAILLDPGAPLYSLVAVAQSRGIDVSSLPGVHPRVGDSMGSVMTEALRAVS